MFRDGIGVSKSIIIIDTWKITNHSAMLHLPVTRETSQQPAVQLVIRVTLLMGSERFLWRVKTGTGGEAGVERGEVW